MGGEPVVNKSAKRQIPVAKPSIGPAEREAVAKVMESGWISQGPVVEEFEREFAEAHGKKFGVCCNSGTTALQLALMAAGVSLGGPKEIVACPVMTMIAVPNAILSAGGEPCFIDSNPSDGNPRLNDLNDPSVVSPCPDAVIVPHLYGVPAEFWRLCDGVPVIEDCAEAHYATFANGFPVGSHGDFACFSFYANKIITTIEGGMVLADDADAADRLRGLRSHAFTAGEHFHHSEHALGARITDLQAAIGLAQHRRRHDLTTRRRIIMSLYVGSLSQIPWVQFQERTAGSANWVCPILIRDGFGITRDSVRHHLAEAGIETRSWFKPAHLQPHLTRFASGKYPVAEELYRRGLYLPLFPDLDDSDVEYICQSVASIR